MSTLNDTHSLERTLDYCDKNNESFLNTTDCSISNMNISTVATTGCPPNQKAIIISSSDESGQQSRASHIHFNQLWSVWYGILLTIFQGYLIVQGLQKYIGKHERVVMEVP